MPFLLAMQSGGDWPSQLSHGPCPMAPALISRVGSSSRQAAKSAKSNDEVRKVCLWVECAALTCGQTDMQWNREDFLNAVACVVNSNSDYCTCVV